MKKNDASERAASLLHQAVDVLVRAAHAPASPVNAFIPAKVRRQMRRDAARLRAGKPGPKLARLHTPEELADVYERTAHRDEILEKAVKDFEQITVALGRVFEEDKPTVQAAAGALVREAKRSAEEHGPHSEAAERYRQLLFLGWFGLESHERRRNLRGRPARRAATPAPDRSAVARRATSAAEPIVAIPPEGGGSGRERMLFRIGTGASSWIGSFERGHQGDNTVLMMPDGKHLFVAAGGAGYVIEAESRTLVETIGLDVAGVMCNERMTVIMVDHDGRSLELFDRTGRVGKAERISAGGFRELRITGNALTGEARHWWREGWVPFRVDFATGEVRYAL